MVSAYAVNARPFLVRRVGTITIYSINVGRKEWFGGIFQGGNGQNL